MWVDYIDNNPEGQSPRIAPTVATEASLPTLLFEQALMDPDFLARLRERIKRRRSGIQKDWSEPLLVQSAHENKDRYEQSRLDRKITWQYNRSGKKVPLFKRPYLSA